METDQITTPRSIPNDLLESSPSFGGEEAIEVYHYDDLLAYGSEAKVKERGYFVSKTKTTSSRKRIMMYFRFNV